MIFTNHSKLTGLHALFSPSQPAWLRYDDEKALSYKKNKEAAAYGTRLHAVAKELIDLRLSMPRSKKTFNKYVNDAIGFQMNTEVVLYYSERFFGTADSITFKNNLLRIHDLKTGTGPVHKEQLEIYAALFCLEYNYKPKEIKMELRIYQNDDVNEWEPDPDDIQEIMNKIIHLDMLLMESNMEEIA